MNNPGSPTPTEEWIQHNRTFRPGCAIFLDGVCQNRGYLSVERCKDIEAEIQGSFTPPTEAEYVQDTHRNRSSPPSSPRFLPALGFPTAETSGTKRDPGAFPGELLEEAKTPLPPHPDGTQPLLPPDHTEFVEQVFRNLGAMGQWRRHPTGPASSTSSPRS